MYCGNTIDRRRSDGIAGDLERSGDRYELLKKLGVF